MSGIVSRESLALFLRLSFTNSGLACIAAFHAVIVRGNACLRIIKDPCDWSSAKLRGQPVGEIPEIDERVARFRPSHKNISEEIGRGKRSRSSSGFHVAFAGEQRQAYDIDRSGRTINSVADGEGAQETPPF